MNILSLFDGISCGYLALQRAGIKIDEYYASEIDKYAIAISKYNFPDIIRLGDVRKIRATELAKLLAKTDLLLAGFPCQSFSIAGNRKGFDDERGNLFFDLMRVMEEVKPRYFLFENVASMKKEDRARLDEIIGVKSVMINSALVSAQQRKRLYWTNIQGNEVVDLFGNRPIGQPEDKGIYLKDILEKGLVDREKSYCIDANYHKGGNLKSYFEKGRRQLVFQKPVRIGQIGKGGQGERIYDIKGKSVCLSAKGGGQGAKTGLYLIVKEATKKGFVEIPPKCGVDLTQPNSKTRRGRKMEFKSNCLMANPNQYYWNNGNCIRKLTPKECERLQTLPDNYTAKGIMDDKEVEISNTRRYMACGNGWTVDVISHIFKFLPHSTQ